MGRLGVVMRPAWLRSPHSRSEIGPVKELDIPLHPDDVFAVGNVQKWDQRRKESVGLVWLI